jgi:tRNA-splicing ligase RtcB
MRAAINCALANRQILTHLVREVFRELLPQAALPLLYDVSHNTAKWKPTGRDVRAPQGRASRIGLRSCRRPTRAVMMLINNSMGAESCLLAGTRESEARAFSSACHGAGRAMSRHQALRNYKGRKVLDDLAARGIIVKSPSLRGIAEEAPQAYKDVSEVVDATAAAGLARKVARTEPLVCVKG